MPGAKFWHVTAAVQSTATEFMGRLDRIFLQVGINHRLEKYPPTGEIVAAVEALERYRAKIAFVGVSYATVLPGYQQANLNRLNREMQQMRIDYVAPLKTQEVRVLPRDTDHIHHVKNTVDRVVQTMVEFHQRRQVRLDPSSGK